METVMGMERSIRYVCLDVRQENVAVAAADSGVRAERNWSKVGYSTSPAATTALPRAHRFDRDNLRSELRKRSWFSVC